MNSVPHDIAIEREVLSSFLAYSQDRYMPRLRETLFFQLPHQLIAKTIQDLHDDGMLHNLSLVTSRLRDLGKLESVGGAAYLRELVELAWTEEATDHYLGVLENKAIRRSLIRLAAELHQKSLDMGSDTEELNAVIETMAERVVSQGADKQKSMGEVVDANLDFVLSELDGIQGMSTGLSDLDKRIKGLSQGSYIIAGKPGSGKTSMVINMMIRQAEAGHIVGFISLEMPMEKILAWMIDFKLNRDHSYIPVGGTRDGWRANIQATAEALKKLKIVIDDTCYTDVSEVVSSAYRMRFAKGIEVLYIDYMQLLEAKHSRDGSREREVAMISRRILALKKKLGIPIVTLSQLNREATKSEDNFRPKLEHLRESGAISHDADVVLMLHDPTRYGETGLHEIHVPKNRSGPTTNIKKPIKVRFNKPAKRFENGVEGDPFT